MSMIRITPVEVRVRWDGTDGRPHRLCIGGQEIPVLAVDRVRHEAQAYPEATGPRAMFTVRTQEARYWLIFEPRRRRWTVDALEAWPTVGVLAA